MASLGIHSKTSFSDNPSVNLVVLRKVSYVILVPDSDSDFGIHHWFLRLPFRVTQVTEIKSNLCLFGFKISVNLPDENEVLLACVEKIV